MSKKQVFPSIEIDDLQSDYKNEFDRYTQSIVHQESPFFFYASIASKSRIPFDKKYLFVLYKTRSNQARIGYVSTIYRKHPLVRRQENILKEKSIALQDVYIVSIVGQTKLQIRPHIKSREDSKVWTFEFSHKKIMEEMLSLILQEKDRIQKSITLSSKEMMEFNRKQQRLKEEIKQKEMHNNDLSSLYEDLKQIERQHANENDSLKQELQKYKKEISDLKQKITKIEEQKNLSGQRCMLLTEQVKKLQKNIEQNETTMFRHTEEARTQMKNIEKKYFSEQTRYKLLQQQVQSMQRAHLNVLATATAQNKKLTNQLNQFKLKYEQENISKFEILEDLNRTKALFQIQKKVKQEQNERLSSMKEQEKDRIIKEHMKKIEEQAIKIEQLETKVEELKKIQATLQTQQGQLALRLREMSQMNQRIKLQTLFIGNVLQNDPYRKSFLKESLQSLKQMQVAKTQLLFKLDLLNKTNFHQYIDNHPNLLLLVKTSSGALFAGYSQSPFSPHHDADGRAMLISLTNQNVFYLQPNKKSVTYDDYYIIFGNSEIRIKSLELSVFSNFGIFNGFFNNNGKGVEALLCESKREVPIETYEVHQVFFSQ